MECMCTSKHRVCDTTTQLVRGMPPKTPFERMDVFMNELFFVIGFLLGGVSVAVTMCLIQLYRTKKEEESPK